MRAASKSIFILPIFATLAFLLAVSGAFAGMGLSPGSVTFDNMVRGGYSERYFTVSNPTDDDVNVSVSFEGDVSSWMKVEPANFAMSGVTYKIVKVTVKVPTTAANGDYTGRMLAVARPAPAPGQSGNTISVASLVAGDVNIQISDLQLLRFNVERLEVPDTEECRPIIVTAGIRNTGNVNVTPAFHVDIMSRDGGTILQKYDYSDKPLLPTTATSISLRVPYQMEQFKCIPAGLYTASIRSLAGGSTMDASNLNFQIYPRGALTLGGEILELNAPNNITLGEIAKIEALFKNTGQVPVSAKLNVEAYQGGRLVDTLTSDPADTYIGGVQPLTVYFTPKSGGKYSLVAYAAFEDKKSDVKKADIEVFWPQSYLIAAGVGVAVAAATGYFLLKRKKK